MRLQDQARKIARGAKLISWGQGTVSSVGWSRVKLSKDFFLNDVHQPLIYVVTSGI